MNSQAYRDEVWSVMHGSDDPKRETAFIRLYLDESGDDSPTTQHAVIAGILTNKYGFDGFEEEWKQMLVKHNIDPPLHMKEFGPHGRFANVKPDCRHRLFIDAAKIIDRFRIITIAATLSNDEYKAHFSEQARKTFGVYGMCFNLAVIIAHKKSEADSYRERISFILDSGNPYKHHVLGAHDEMLKVQKKMFLHVGSLTFEADDNLGILQGADVIAWAARRRLATLPFGYSFEPLQNIFQANHIEHSWTSEWFKQLWDALSARIAEAEKNEE